MIIRKALILAGIVVTASAAPAFAHHSFAMFDMDKTVKMQGTVKDFQWTNPHSWLQVMVLGPNGEQQDWSLEMTAPATLASHGWRPHSVSAGDKISFSIHPLKDGTRGGELLEATLPDGKTLGLPAPGYKKD